MTHKHLYLDFDGVLHPNFVGKDLLFCHMQKLTNAIVGKPLRIVMSTSCRVLIDLVTQLTREVDRLGSTVARLKLKGIDGGPHKRWMMWINSMQREKPYLPLTCQEPC